MLETGDYCQRQTGRAISRRNSRAFKVQPSSLKNSRAFAFDQRASSGRSAKRTRPFHSGLFVLQPSRSRSTFVFSFVVGPSPLSPPPLLPCPLKCFESTSFFQFPWKTLDGRISPVYVVLFLTRLHRLVIIYRMSLYIVLVVQAK